MVLDELLIKIKTVQDLGGFDKLSSKLRSTENVVKGSSSNMKNYLNQINTVRFDGVANKFKSAISSMVTYAKSGASSISNSLQSSVQSTEGALMGIAGSLGTVELFNKAMDKQLTKTQLYNIKGKGEGSKVLGQYQQFTEKSSASDEDISKMLRFTFGGKTEQTYRSLNALDAASYSADPLQRKEGIRGWGTYLSGGWSAAAGMMKDEGLRPEQIELLQKAKTYDEKLKALETIAGQKGNLTGKDSLSTTTTGELGKYNKALASYDAIIRGATSSFNTLMGWIEPLITGFNNLDQGAKDVIGTFLTIAAVGATLAMGLGLFLTIISPVTSGLGKVAGKLGEWTGIKKPDWLTSVKDKTINAVNVTVKGKTVTGSGTTAGGTTGKGGIKEQIASMGSWLVGGTVAGTLTTATAGIAGLLGGGYGLNRLQDAGIYKPSGSMLVQGNAGLGPLGAVTNPSFWQGQSGIIETLSKGGSFQDAMKSGIKRMLPDKQTILAGLKLTSLKWPTWKQLYSYITKKVPGIPKFKWPTWNQVLAYIKKIFPAIPTLKWPSVPSISGMINTAVTNAANSVKSAVPSAGGDAQSMLEDASLTKSGPTVNLYVGSIPNKAVADYTLDIIASGLSEKNDAKGR